MNEYNQHQSIFISQMSSSTQVYKRSYINHKTHRAMISFILLLCTLFAIVFGQNPGFRTAITSKGFDYSEQVVYRQHSILSHLLIMFLSWIVDAVGIPILQQQLANVNVPDISGSTSIDVVGKIDYSLSK